MSMVLSHDAFAPLSDAESPSLLSLQPCSPTAELDSHFFGQSTTLRPIPLCGPLKRKESSSSCDTCDVVQEPSKQPRKISKVVSFQDGTKTHDGLTPRSELLEKLLVSFFIYGKDVTETSVMEHIHWSLGALTDLANDVAELAALLTQEESVPMLLRGGGPKGYKILKPHLPHLEALLEVIQAAQQRVVKA